jgi:NAD(P)-dependent dehydrogenase (short-subunit alcohol dehydrogenase family)
MVAPHIRVNSVSPGLLETEWAERFTTEQKADMLEKTKLKRFVTVEDVADQVVALARNRGMTGVNVVMDAGISL